MGPVHRDDQTGRCVNIIVHAGGDPAVLRKLNRILAILQSLTRGNEAMSELLDTLVARVAEIETVGDSAILLLQELKTKLDEAIASEDRDALVALSDRLGAQTQELAEAIVANTPSE